ncbi:lasso RiPP family leader peptide-containing protein [Streptomyces natalensis]|uniref:lasso RiPP family leader peptide-containing protein n=1 Tax=Streptomyces natalensis TaxID=68242 RepID=UPI0012FF1582|nr:lasso RiPP family leader peptide-containing protein [Streptomyces natalensis]
MSTFPLEAEMQHEIENVHMEEPAVEPVTTSYEPPMVTEAGAFAEVTRGGIGTFKEAGVGRFM